MISCLTTVLPEVGPTQTRTQIAMSRLQARDTPIIKTTGMTMKEETAIKGVEKRMTYQIEVKKDTVVMMLDTIQGNGYQAEEMLGEGKIVAQLPPPEGPLGNRQISAQVNLPEEPQGSVQTMAQVSLLEEHYQDQHLIIGKQITLISGILLVALVNLSGKTDWVRGAQVILKWKPNLPINEREKILKARHVKLKTQNE